MRVDAEDVDELQVGEDVGGGKEALRDEHRVPRVPLVPAIQCTNEECSYQVVVSNTCQLVSPSVAHVAPN